MKVLQINKFYYRRRGAETYMLDLMELLEQHGHEVGVFSMEHPDTIDTPFRKHFASHIEFGNLGELSLTQQLQSVGRVIWNREAQRKLDALLYEFKPDIAHIHNIYHQISPSILTILKKHGIPVVHTLHDYKLLAPNYNLLANGEIDESSKGGKYYNVVRKKAMKDSFSASVLAATEMYIHKALQVYEKNVDCFISPSHFLKDKITEWGIKVKRIEVLPNFINTSEITPVYSANPAEQSAEEQTAYLVYAGGLYMEKGVDTLLDSLAGLGYGIQLKIAGDGPERARLEEQANRICGEHSGVSIQFLGHLPKQQLFKLIGNAAAVVVPSRWYENYPYSVLEAFALGKPVIAANIGGLPEMVTPGKTGELFTVNDVADLTRALQTVLQGNVTQLGQTARHQVETINSPHNHYSQLHALYTELTT